MPEYAFFNYQAELMSASSVSGFSAFSMRTRQLLLMCDGIFGGKYNYPIMHYRNMGCLRSVFSCRVISGKIMMLVVVIVLNVAMLEAGTKDNLFSPVFYSRSPPQYHKNVKHSFHCGL